jgi:large subunit ribosomal protein L14
MIIPQTILKVVDNSGASLVKCFNVLKKRKTVGRLGDIIVGSVKETRALEDTKANSRVQKVTKGQVVHGVIVRCKKESRRPDGTYVRFDDNAVVLIDIDKKKGVTPKGTRITGIVGQELRKYNMTKILSLSPLVV